MAPVTIEAEGAEATELPRKFVATTVNVEATPIVIPVIVAYLLVVVTDIFFTTPEIVWEEVSVYDVIAEPPVEDGALQPTDAHPLPEPKLVTVTAVGAPGTVDGITAAEAEEEAELPTEFLAFTVNVYDEPLVNAVKVAVRTTPTFTTMPPPEVTVYPVIAAPPFDAGAVQLTVAVALPETAETPVGAPGTVDILYLWAILKV